METLLYALALKMKDPRGIPAIGLTPGEPVVMPEVTLADSAVMSGRMTNVTVHGITRHLTPEWSKIT